MTRPLTVALLVGGQSRRMGQDKVWLRDPETGLIAWQRQATLLESFNPDRCLISMRDGQRRLPLADGSWEVVCDEAPNLGPIGALSACLHAASEGLLMVLAVDMLGMTDAVLQGLWEHCDSTTGFVGQRGGYYEPLAAVYPARLAASAGAFWRSGGRRLQDWVGNEVRAGNLRTASLSHGEAKAFANINTREAWQALSEIARP